VISTKDQEPRTKDSAALNNLSSFGCGHQAALGTYAGRLQVYCRLPLDLQPTVPEVRGLLHINELGRAFPVRGVWGALRSSLLGAWEG
jgi:hypothetical protein